ncbi:BFD-like [2Fe-2S] binding domain protein [Candidatus Izimaplasma bacterium HR1]|jgi:nitrite reductase (NADH) large subunit|uniref:(2Fe-2S)-binding protein n=1 Tax=Candidatus Izimoplasma sp. HR1 TaxID=1541959 RepID=UPI0004F683EC|nr:BFD-like [2Fe-2S] binding domain protein [Candidatus Izimaplasma bacterium HR1]
MKRDLSEIICHCEEITYKEILKAIKDGAKIAEDISDQTNAGIACGYCIEAIEEILEEEL